MLQRNQIVAICFIALALLCLGVYYFTSDNTKIKVCDSYSIQTPTTSSICYDTDIYYSTNRLEVKR